MGQAGSTFACVAVSADPIVKRFVQAIPVGPPCRKSNSKFIFRKVLFQKLFCTGWTNRNGLHISFYYWISWYSYTGKGWPDLAHLAVPATLPAMSKCKQTIPTRSADRPTKARCSTTIACLVVLPLLLAHPVVLLWSYAFWSTNMLQTRFLSQEEIPRYPFPNSFILMDCLSNSWISLGFKI